MLYAHLQHRNDTINKQTQEDFFTNILYLSLYCKGSKRVTQGLRVRGSCRPNITAIFWPPNLWPSAMCLSRSPGLLNRRPKTHSAGWWLSLLHLISIFPGPQLIMAPSPIQPGVALPTTSRLIPTVCNSTGTWLPSWLRYIIIQRPHDRPLNLWNRMFNRHQAEITVMQFTGHSLPVHQSMSVPWEFFSSSHFISQFPPTRFPIITAIRICHLLPVHHLGMAFLAGSKSQNTANICDLVWLCFLMYQSL